MNYPEQTAERKENTEKQNQKKKIQDSISKWQCDSYSLIYMQSESLKDWKGRLRQKEISEEILAKITLSLMKTINPQIKKLKHISHPKHEKYEEN